MVCLGNELGSFSHFWDCTQVLHFVDYEGYSVSSKGFLPIVGGIMVIWMKFAHSCPFSSLISKMSMFALAISCLTTSNLPWFVDLTFQVPMQSWSLQHQTLLLSPVTSTTGYYFHFGSASSFFLDLFLHSPPIAYWASAYMEVQFFNVISFLPFHIFMGFSRQEYWSGFPFPSPVDHILSDLSNMTCPSWVAPLAWLGFIELDKAVVLVWLDWLI